MKDHEKNTIYLRQRGDKWECMAKSEAGNGIMLKDIPSRDLAIRSITFLLWGINTFGREKYGSEMEQLEGAPEGVEFPVVEEEPIK